MRCGLLGLLLRSGLEATKKGVAVAAFYGEINKSQTPSPHWHLSPLGVDPEFQGKGLASKLLRPILARIDQDQLPCYLETQNEKAISLYQHFGFEVVESGTMPEINIPF